MLAEASERQRPNELFKLTRELGRNLAPGEIAS